MKHLSVKAVRNSFTTCGFNFQRDGDIVPGYEFIGSLNTRLRQILLVDKTEDYQRDYRLANL